MHPSRALVAGVLHVVAGVLPGFLAASLAPRIDADFPFSESALGAAVAVVYVACALLSSPAGHLVERAGARRAMVAGAASTIVCCLGVAAVAESAVALAALLVLGGVGNAIAAPAASAVLGRHVPERRHGVAFGAMQAGAPLGAVMAGLALPAVAIPFGWRWAFVATAAVAAAAALVAPPAGRAGPATTGERPRGPTSVHALADTAWLASSAGTGLVSFIVLYAVESGMSQSAAGLLLAALSVAAAGSRIAIGVRLDRGGGDPLRPAAAMMAVGAVGFVALVSGVPAVIVVGALMAGGAGWGWTGALTSAVVARAPQAPAWAVGVMMAGLFAGSVTGPLATGLLAEREQFTAAWLTLAAFALAAAATVALVSRRSARSGPAPTR
jgi:predicted MFS family arabinose efflux permease